MAKRRRFAAAVQTGWVRGLDGDLGLLVTGSSDYHCDGKANRLGENLTAPEVLAAIEERGTTDVIRP